VRKENLFSDNKSNFVNRWESVCLTKIITIKKGFSTCGSRTTRCRQGVNFVNIIRTNFLYERRFFSSNILALLKNLYEKRACIMLMKLTTDLLFCEHLIKYRRISFFAVSVFDNLFICECKISLKGQNNSQSKTYLFANSVFAVKNSET